MNTHPILTNNTKIDVFIDSGSTINILDKNSFKLIKPKPTITKSKTKIYPYQSDSPLQLHSVTTAIVTENNTSLPTKFYIIKGNYDSLLGKAIAEALNLLCMGHHSKQLQLSMFN